MDIVTKLLKEIIEILNKYLAILDKPVEAPVEKITEELVEEPVTEDNMAKEVIKEVVEVINYPDEEPNEEPIPITEIILEPEMEPIGAPIQQTTECPLYEIDILVDEILEGKWGSGSTRKQNLEKAGYVYDQVQQRVNEILQVVEEVLDGKWGAGDERKKRLTEAGYSYDTVQRQINRQLNNNTHAQTIMKMNAWAKKIAADNRYHYMLWSSNDAQTHKCPICSKVNYDKDKKHFGWNCIGFAWAVWHHGGGLKSKCNCHVIANDIGEKIYNAKTDTEALSIAKKYVGIDDIVVIRNKGDNIPKSKWQAGDICLQFNGTKYIHTFYYMGNGQVADSTGSSGNIANDKQIGVRSYRNYSAKVIIRWITNQTTVKTKTIEELAKEVLNGEWGNGDARKANLEAAGYDYNAVQTKINELLQTQTKTYNGQLPTTKLIKTNAEVIADTIKWAVWIAGDNRFHYGGSRESNYNGHKNGCYFCGTNLKTKPKAMVDRERSYCCNPFIGAAWAHGGCVPTALKMCRNGKSWGFSKNNGYSTSKLFTNLGHPNKSKLKPGDVLCKDTHVAMYIGNGLLVEAAGHDDNKRNSTKWNNSIHTAKLTDSRYKGFSRVHRFNGSVNTDTYICHGEVSKRVAQWQAFLDWYFDGKVGSADGIYGDNTLKWTKKFQEEQIGPGQGDGIIGNKTLEAAKKCKK